MTADLALMGQPVRLDLCPLGPHHGPLVPLPDEDVGKVVVDERQLGSGHLFDVVKVPVQPAVKFLN